MKVKLNVIPALLLFFSSNLFAQTTYYKVNGGNSIDVKKYEEIKI